jgi:L-fucose isomerase-like protein
MFMPLGQFSPKIKLGFVSASRNCFPRSLSEERAKALLEAARARGLEPVVPAEACWIIESKEHARQAARELRAAGCDAAVLFLGNFSPEIEDAAFAREFGGDLLLIAAAEESRASLGRARGDALCGLLSAALAIERRGLRPRVHLPENPIVDAERGAEAIVRFERVMRVVKGTRAATVGLFGPRPRDFETCNYNVASLGSIGVEVEEFGFFDLANEVKRVKANEDTGAIAESFEKSIRGVPGREFARRLSSYEKAVLNLREANRLSGMATQCWTEQEMELKHVPCSINARMASLGFPIACENDCYSLVAELIGQYASDSGVTILDLNHSIPLDLDASLAGMNAHDLVGLFHCGNTDPARLKNPEMKHQVIMKRIMEPDGEADITRGTIEGQIAASPITIVQVAGAGDKLRAYVAEGEFLDLDPNTFGCTGTAHVPGFMRFYRHVLLGRFHHHAAVAFAHCAETIFDAFKLLGVDEIYAPLPDWALYPGENPFTTGRTPALRSAKAGDGNGAGRPALAGAKSKAD